MTTGSVAQVNLVSNGQIPASNADPDLVNAWGIAASPTGPALDRRPGHPGLATVFDVVGDPRLAGRHDPRGVADRRRVQPRLEEGVRAPGTVPGRPTPRPGRVPLRHRGRDDQRPGTRGVSPTTAITTVDNSAAERPVYTGLAVAGEQSGGSEVLYARPTSTRGSVEMYGPDFNPIGSFTDPTLPSGYAPYNVATCIGGVLYVAFTLQAGRRRPATRSPALGNGYIDVFSPSGVLLLAVRLERPLERAVGRWRLGPVELRPVQRRPCWSPTRATGGSMPSTRPAGPTSVRSSTPRIRPCRSTACTA